MRIVSERAVGITERAKAFGADLAGIVNLEDLIHSPAYLLAPKAGYFANRSKDKEREIRRDLPSWLVEAKSAIVIAVHHPENEPQLDWWISQRGSVGNTEGNVILMRIMAKLADWLEREQGIRCFKVPYNVDRGGVFMKDAAVLGGLGCIGKNNLLLTPEFGPRVRLRVMLLSVDLPSTGMMNFAPCKKCEEPCRKACPQKAFAKELYSSDEFGIKTLPGQSGMYNRIRCNNEMVRNESEAEIVTSEDDTGRRELVKYCRLCELVCPVDTK